MKAAALSEVSLLPENPLRRRSLVDSAHPPLVDGTAKFLLGEVEARLRTELAQPCQHPSDVLDVDCVHFSGNQPSHRGPVSGDDEYNTFGDSMDEFAESSLGLIDPDCLMLVLVALVTDHGDLL
jgi:hypothetical protein